MNPHYYIMKNKKILRLEAETSFTSVLQGIQDNVFDPEEITPLDQDQANWRVAIFRDEILDLEEYIEWLKSSETQEPDEVECDLVAN
jgi:hypothetical protein